MDTTEKVVKMFAEKYRQMHTTHYSDTRYECDAAIYFAMSVLGVMLGTDKAREIEKAALRYEKMMIKQEEQVAAFKAQGFPIDALEIAKDGSVVVRDGWKKGA